MSLHWMGDILATGVWAPTGWKINLQLEFHSEKKASSREEKGAVCGSSRMGLEGIGDSSTLLEIYLFIYIKCD